MFYVGQKVVCVDDVWDERQNPEKNPIAGNVYTVRAVSMGTSNRFGRSQTLRLVEIVNPPFPYRQGVHELWFAAPRFRPVVERKTDISIFTKMLTPNERALEKAD